LGEFLPLAIVFDGQYFIKITELAQRGLLFHQLKLFYAKMDWASSLAIFSQTHLVTLVTRVT
jgi:hypothetical protein